MFSGKSSHSKICIKRIEFFSHSKLFSWWYLLSFGGKLRYFEEEWQHIPFTSIPILNLGIKRECVGDIYVFEKEAYVFITPELVDYIKINLTKVGSVGVVIEEVALKDVKLPELSFEEIKFTVQSLRLDSIASGIFRVSRE